MTKRLKYTKDILTHMLNSNNKVPSTATGSGLGIMGGTGSNTGMNTVQSRVGTITSAASSKRSVALSGTGESGMPSSVGRTGP